MRISYQNIIDFSSISTWRTINAEKPRLHIGGIFPMKADNGGWAGGQACLPAAQLALEDVNNNTLLLKDYDLHLTWYDSEVSRKDQFLKTLKLVNVK